jgi:hypothetical protein
LSIREKAQEMLDEDWLVHAIQAESNPSKTALPVQLHGELKLPGIVSSRRLPRIGEQRAHCRHIGALKGRDF